MKNIITAVSLLFLFSSSYTALSKNNKEEELCVILVCRDLTWTNKFKHCGTFIHKCGSYTEDAIRNQYSLQGFAFQYDPENSGSSTYKADRNAFLNLDDPDIFYQKIAPPPGMLPNELVDLIRINAKLYKTNVYWPYGPNSNSAADFPLYRSGIDTQAIEGALGLHHYHKTNALNNLLNDAVELFYTHAQDRLTGLIEQIKHKTIKSGKFKDLNIGDSKLTVIDRLKKMQAYYVSTQNQLTNGNYTSAPKGMIDLRPESDDLVENRLLYSDAWNVTYDSNGETFWNLQLNFIDDKLDEINIKSSNLELP